MEEFTLVFQHDFSMKFVTNHYSNSFSFDGSFVGEIKDFINKIPAIKSKRLFYVYPANFYITLEKYSVENHYIEYIKKFFNISTIPYNLCTYKGKMYIMYISYPQYEMTYRLLGKNAYDITEEERKIYLFHWLLGVRGKYMKVKSKTGYLYYSRANYGKINKKRSEITKTAITKLFYGFDNIVNTMINLYNDNGYDKLRDLLQNQNYWWFYDIDVKLHLYYTPSWH